ncbi:hypothetical protein DCS_03531 [Drechmeria coniospora]|uniref:Uncharacterized protein n=1 Tax=Drechmeria coniospora TaxID=98403 RepID=A0A151GHL1_DRECN|nr:hypothetical protein DCS_03531 [Drechmeria coniospora]KYK56531.1 hypothetical protein DCS_03531 [Drechmeria coniospora]
MDLNDKRDSFFVNPFLITLNAKFKAVGAKWLGHHSKQPVQAQPPKFQLLDSRTAVAYTLERPRDQPQWERYSEEFISFGNLDLRIARATPEPISSFSPLKSLPPPTQSPQNLRRYRTKMRLFRIKTAVHLL